MKNYYSKFDLENTDQKQVKLDLTKYKQYGALLTIILYVTLFFVVAVNLSNPTLRLIVKVIAFVVGFGLNIFGQTYFTKKLKTGNQPNKLPPLELAKVRKYYEPNVIFLTLFFLLILIQNQPMNSLIYGLIILGVSIGHMIWKLKLDEAI